jgi:hypothetical protein
MASPTGQIPLVSKETQMQLDTSLSKLVDEVLSEEPDTSVTPQRSWVKLADLSEHSSTRIVTIRPRRRTYLHQSDAGYDWASGHEFVITSRSSPYYGDIVAVDETQHLKRYGYTHIHIHYNINSAPLELKL